MKKKHSVVRPTILSYLFVLVLATSVVKLPLGHGDRVVQDERPNKAKYEFELAVHHVGRVNVDQFDALHILQEVQRHGHILQLLGAEHGLAVVARQLFVREDLDERDYVQAVAEVHL